MCSICKAPLTVRATNGDPEAIVGDECHIVARSHDGPRGGQLAAGMSVDAYANLILLCAAHHRLVDGQPLTYTAQELRRIKVEHERWAEDRLREPSHQERKEEGGEESREREDETSGVSARANALEESLRRHAALRYGSLDVPTPDHHRRVPIDELYVPAPFVLEEEPPPTLYEQLIRKTFRIVILGSPGSGKSTLAQKLCFDLATNSAPLVDGLTPVGVVVRLRSAASALTRDRSPLEALRALLAGVIDAEFQLPADPEALDHLLRAGRLTPVFDGLDELPTVEQRELARDALEDFATHYSNTPMIVTSRVIGYDHAPLAALHFRRAAIRDFSAEQVSTYAQRWFGSVAEDRGRAERLTSVFLQESAVVPELLRNPLMLSLLCTLYRDRGQLEHSRTLVYERAAELLFNRWDRLRGIETPERPPWFRPLIRRLAWTMLTDVHAGVGITASAATRIVTEYLVGTHDWERGAARDAAQSLLEFCVGRAWVFTEVGSTPEGEGIFQFSHRTFLEFFAAEYLASSAARPSDVADDMLRRLRECDEIVPLLVAQLWSRHRLGDVVELLDALGRAAITQQDIAIVDSFATSVGELMGGEN
jgi:hypothetical protein